MLFGKNKTHNLFLMFHSLHSTLFHRLRLLWAYIENFVFFFTQRAISVPFQQFYRAKIYVETQQKCKHISKFILCKISTTISLVWESQQFILYNVLCLHNQNRVTILLLSSADLVLDCTFCTIAVKSWEDLICLK